MNKWIIKRRILQIKVFISKLVGQGGASRSELMRKSGLFYKMGKGGAWHPGTVPTEPWLMNIGENLVVAAGVSFITHDVCHRTLNACYEEKVVPYLGTITIGDNVTICANTMIMPNVKIGSNVIIGAGSIVTKDIPSFTVYAGNPAHYICDLETLYKKRLLEKNDLTSEYDAEKMKEYFWGS
jgi:acetyltransferase-like isoleucine patch superfamily enzyme